MNAKEVIKLKEKSRERVLAVISGYDMWIGKTQIFSNRVYLIMGVASLGLLGYFKMYWDRWWLVGIVLIMLAIHSFIKLVHREGHREGYLDGYDAGFDDGVNKALGIDKEGQEFLAKIETDISLDELKK